jgi:hypothetical protein
MPAYLDGCFVPLPWATTQTRYVSVNEFRRTHAHADRERHTRTCVQPLIRRERERERKTERENAAGQVGFG